MTAKQKIFIYIFIVFAMAFIGTQPFQPYTGDFFIKAIPAISLSLFALTTFPGLTGSLLFVALLFCAAGDMALELEAGRYFVIGLGLFLIAQILFIVNFSRDFQMQKSRIPIITTLVIYALVIALILKPTLKEIAIPVYFYIAVITTMGIFAALRASRGKLVLYGALSFIISDSILAINKFTVPVPADDYIGMFTYYLALFLIAYGHVRSD